MKPVITAKSISKEYRIGSRTSAYSTLRDSFAGTLSALKNRRRRNNAETDRIIWALKDVDFEVQTGEVVGLVGRNGAGKSTLLKIISRITEPTSGRIELYAKTGSLLEVGTGFHQELTGRENVFLNGAILGMGREQTARRFDEIVAFAEIEKFIDTPVKFYSSGMYVRLAFAVAAHLEPEILIVDEVLSVGDMAFQQKCLDKMREMRQQTHAIILVSHNMISIRAICSRAMLLSRGTIVADGVPGTVVPLYEKAVAENEENGDNWDEIANGTGQVRITAISLTDSSSKKRQTFEIGEKVNVVIEYNAIERIEGAVAYAAIRRPDDFICVATSTKLEGVTLPPLEGPGVISFEIPELLVVPGHYVLDVVFYDHNIDYRSYFVGRKRVEFNVTSTITTFDGMYGVFYQRQNWKINGHTARIGDSELQTPQQQEPAQE
jgi:lipopolysaccharide transport system ATP-binding protein